MSRSQSVWSSTSSHGSHGHRALTPLPKEAAGWSKQQDQTHVRRLEAMGSLTASLAHDFKNLVTAVLHGCELLLARHTPQSPDYDDIVYMRAAAERAKDLAQQTLFVAKGSRRAPSLIDVDQAIAELAPMLDRLLGDAVTLILEPNCSGARVCLESSQFTQVILNLVTNARDAMPEGGRLMIRTGMSESESITRPADGAFDGTRQVMIDVTDTGTGIPDSIRANVFDPFFTTRSEDGGTGLGLATVQRIVDGAGGTARVANSSGEGTTISIRLPEFSQIADARSANSDKSRADATRFAAVVLLVEDEDAVRRFAARALRSKGYDVIEARTGEEGLNHLCRSDVAVDLLISDLVLPGVNGDEFCRRALEANGTLAAILVSGYGNAAEQAENISCKYFATLSKPYALADLIDAADQLIARRARAGDMPSVACSNPA